MYGSTVTTSASVGTCLAVSTVTATDERLRQASVLSSGSIQILETQISIAIGDPDRKTQSRSFS